MPQSKLLVHPRKSADGVVQKITPESAGWTYVGFEARDLEKGARVALKQRRDGSLRRRAFRQGAGHGRRTLIPARSASAPMCSKACPGRSICRAHSAYAIEAVTDCELAICTAPATGKLPPRVIAPGDVETLTRGKGSNTRHVRNILSETASAESLLVVEVITPGGNWSSYPPAQARPRRAARRILSRRDLLPSPVAAAGLCLAARLYRRPLARRDAGGRRPRRGAGAARLSSRSARRMAMISTISM